tara:strand:- start:1313 stop:2431 length:1119 start_codon:yes stop_codon:yes gene_type:complete
MEKKKVVCHITTVHIPKDIRIYHKECKSLADAGYDVKLVAVNASDIISDYDGIEIINVPLEARSKIKRIINAPKKARIAAEKCKADIYHFHDPEFLFSALKMLNRGAVVIYDSHEDVPNQVRSKYWIPRIIRPIISSLVFWIEMKIARKLSAIVTVVDSIANRFLKANQNVVQVRNFPNLEEFPTPGSWNLKSSAACYVGDFTRIRGIYESIDSLSISRGEMILAGRFPSKDFEDEVCALEGWRKVDFRGFVSRVEISQILNQSKFGLVTLYPTPSYKEALPVKLFEYMAAGLAVIASDFGLMKQIVDKYNCGLVVNPQKPEEIAKAIDWLIDNDEEAQKMGQRGREAVVKNYNWAAEEKKLLSLYDSLLSQ